MAFGQEEYFGVADHSRFLVLDSGNDDYYEDNDEFDDELEDEDDDDEEDIDEEY